MNINIDNLDNNNKKAIKELTDQPVLSFPSGNYFLSDPTNISTFVIVYDTSNNRLTQQLLGPSVFPNVDQKQYTDLLNKCQWQYTYNADDNFGYLTNNIIRERGVISILGNDEQGLKMIVSPLNKTVSDQNIQLLSNGTIKSIKFNKCLMYGTTNIQFSIDCVPHVWKISRVPPKIGRLPSLWDNANVFPLDPQTANTMYWNENYGDPCNGFECSNHCSTNSGCDETNGQTRIHAESCNSGFARRSYCLYNRWPEQNKSACCNGIPVPGVIQPDGKLDIYQCKTSYPTSVGGHNVDPTYIYNEAWAPWTEACSNDDGMMTFCSDRDSTTEKSMTISNANCASWCSRHPDNCKLARVSYCRSFPQDPNCNEWCRDNPEDCQSQLSNFCKGEFLNSDVCQKYCSLPNVNCDSVLIDYANTLYKQDPNKAISNPILGCFLPQEYYDKYYNDLNSKILGLQTVPRINTCFYSRCANSTQQTFTVKQKPPGCPNINACIQVANINVDGSIAGDVTVSQTMECQSNFQKKLDPASCDKTQYLDLTSNVCIDCPVNSIPDYLNQKCQYCGEGFYNVDGKCGSCETGQITVDAKCKQCPQDYIASDNNCIACGENQTAQGNKCVQTFSDKLRTKSTKFILTVIVSIFTLVAIGISFTKIPFKIIILITSIIIVIVSIILIFTFKTKLAPPPLDFKCQSQKECPDGYFCNFDGTCKAFLPCNTHTDCPYGTECSDNKNCIPKLQPECVSNVNCKDGKLCMDSKCKSCSSNEDCLKYTTDKQVCDNSICTSININDCKNGTTLKDYSCQYVCNSQIVCPSGTICANTILNTKQPYCFTITNTPITMDNKKVDNIWANINGSVDDSLIIVTKISYTNTSGYNPPGTFKCLCYTKLINSGNDGLLHMVYTDNDISYLGLISRFGFGTIGPFLYSNGINYVATGTFIQMGYVGSTY